MCVVASLTIERAFDRYFSTRTRTVMENSRTVALAYVDEHAQTVRAEIKAMAVDLANAKPMFDADRERFRQFLMAQASLRGLPARMIDGDLREIERADLGFNREFHGPPAEELAKVGEDEPQIGLFLNDGYVAAIIKLRGYDNIYLYAARPLNPQVLEQLLSVAARDDLLKRVEEAFDRELLEEAVRRVRLRVEPRTWEAFQLTTEGGLSGAEASARIGMRVSQVYVAKRRVQQMLQDEVQKLEQGA